jgi:hypothetical protein
MKLISLVYIHKRKKRTHYLHISNWIPIVAEKVLSIFFLRLGTLEFRAQVILLLQYM